MRAATAQAYLVNTGWNGSGKRISIGDTRLIIDAILAGNLDNCEIVQLPVFGLGIPKRVQGIERRILDPRNTYANRSEWYQKAKTLAIRFTKNFVQFGDSYRGRELIASGPVADGEEPLVSLQL